MTGWTAAAADDGTGNVVEWPIILGAVGVVTSLIVGVGGLIKNRADAKVGLGSETRKEMTLFEARYQAILDEVRESLVDPLRVEVDRLRGELDTLREDLAAERAAGKLTLRQYRSALAHIRGLRAWVTMHDLTNVVQDDLPDVPPSIRDDLG